MIETFLLVLMTGNGITVVPGYESLTKCAEAVEAWRAAKFGYGNALCLPGPGMGLIVHTEPSPIVPPGQSRDTR